MELSVDVGGWAAAAVVVAALLVRSGTAKVWPSASAAPPEALVVLAGSKPRARLALRAVGLGELAVAGAVLFAPPAGGGVVAVLGVVFCGYLAWARKVAPGSSCGCGSEASPITWRTFARAATLTAGGTVVGVGTHPWWQVAQLRPVAFVAALLCCAAVVLAVSPASYRWLLPLRRLRVRLFGHPLAADEDLPPAAAAVELLEASVAWQSTAHVVRSSLLEHWLVDGWRILRYAGRYGARPVTVLFAVDARARLGDRGEPVVRVSVLDDETDEQLALASP
ncbi:MAG: hypothetical protein GEV07_01460 [Streptosporangiales bacterium]|nr:hypothetical protein [Streptosporangiales bacterium]